MKLILCVRVFVFPIRSSPAPIRLITQVFLRPPSSARLDFPSHPPSLCVSSLFLYFYPCAQFVFPVASGAEGLCSCLFLQLFSLRLFLLFWRAKIKQIFLGLRQLSRFLPASFFGPQTSLMSPCRAALNDNFFRNNFSLLFCFHFFPSLFALGLCRGLPSNSLVLFHFFMLFWFVSSLADTPIFSPTYCREFLILFRGPWAARRQLLVFICFAGKWVEASDSGLRKSGGKKKFFI